MRIASLLPASTEIVCALGLRERLVGVSHECDFPVEVKSLPRLTGAHVDSSKGSAAIHEQVGGRLSSGLSLYEVLEDELARVKPDLIITQDTCDICAVAQSDVEAAVANIVGRETRILSLAPKTLDDVFANISSVGEATNSITAAQTLTENLKKRLRTLKKECAERAPMTVLFLEWLDPPMVGGHWTPTLTETAGGIPILGHKNQPTRAVTWQEIRESDPDCIAVAPCGFPTAQTERELPALLEGPLSSMRATQEGRVFVIDGNAYFNRPGPRLVDSAETLARILTSCANS